MAQIDDWASDASFPAGSDPWSAQPTKVEPPGAIKGRGFLPGTTPPAGWFNWLLNAIIAGINQFAATFGVSGGELIYVDANGDPDPKAFAIQIPGIAFGLKSGVTDNAGGDIALTTDSVVTRKALADLLPDGAIITEIRAVVNPGTGRATAGDRVGVQLIEVTGATSSPAAAGTAAGIPASGPKRDDGTTNLQTITVNSGDGLPKTVAKGTAQLYLAVQAGNDGGAHNTDTIHFVEVIGTVPGPRL